MFLKNLGLSKFRVMNFTQNYVTDQIDGLAGVDDLAPPDELA